MGARLKENKFDVITNPFGTIFNPISIFRLIDYAATGNLPPSNTYVENEGIWKNLDFHSDFSASDKQTLEASIAATIRMVKERLPALSYLLITPGTALVYETKTENRLVANCHKLPASFFNHKRMLEVDEIMNAFEQLKQKLEILNPNIRYIFTVSPVRHVKDTLELNSWSKSTLLLAVKKMSIAYENVEYFPSYEIMMDDLRDYRFYTSDMLHPTTIAEDYIWNKFAKWYFREETIDFLNQWSKIKEAIAHRPFHPDSPAYQTFLKKTISKLDALNKITDVGNEMEILKTRLKDEQ